MTHIAILDDEGVYKGHKPVPEGYELQEGDVEVPEDCDLGIDKYRWDGKTFQAVPKATPEELVNEQHTLVAIALGFEAIRESGIVELPELTLKWLDWYKTTLDAKGYFSEAAKGK